MSKLDKQSEMLQKLYKIYVENKREQNKTPLTYEEWFQNQQENVIYKITQ